MTFDKVHTYGWYRSRLYSLSASDYAPTDKLRALTKAVEWGDHIPVGIFYREEKPTSEDREPALAEGPLVSQRESQGNLDSLLEEFQ